MAADRGHKRPTRTSRPGKLPTYQEVLAEFERRTNVIPAAEQARLPSPEEMFTEFEQRSGQRL